MNQVTVSGVIKSIEFNKYDNEYETRIIISANDGKNKENLEFIPIKFVGVLAPMSFVELGINKFIYVMGQIKMTKENKLIVVGMYYEDKSKVNIKPVDRSKFLIDYSPERIKELIDNAMKKQMDEAQKKEAYNLYVAKDIAKIK